jgi:hypothetical protein
VFQVDWNDTAATRLVSIVRDASPGLRRRIRTALDRIDVAMLNDPSRVGESQAGGLRVEIFEPLTIWFRVNVRLQRVLIVRVRIPPKWMD